jgi:S-adenosylmethionine:tRNA ribosyltransferase-isomerase
MYQTVFAAEPGSAEMPSAGRPFSVALVQRLRASGVHVEPIVLHTGVSSQEHHEPPYDEFFRVSRETAERVNAARRDGRRVIAVGTTVVRALETVTDEDGTFPGEGWTRLVITPERPVRSVNGLITGLHEPQASHLQLLESVVCGAMAATADGDDRGEVRERAHAHLARAYAAARSGGYLWHEFGDSHLIVSR